MKIFIKFLFLITILFTFSVNDLYAKNGWFLVGYSYTFPDSGYMDGLNGPVSITAGGDLWKFIGLEVALSSRWSSIGTYYYNVWDYRFKSNITLWSFDIKPYIMLQPKIGVDAVALRPYFGIGPSFHLSGIQASNIIDDYSFDVGFSAKAGLRLQLVKFLFIGAGAEYLYHKSKLGYINYNFSGFTVGAEVGFTW